VLLFVVIMAMTTRSDIMIILVGDKATREVDCGGQKIMDGA
jgi:hypothetical protein